jgi:hypothetical protein
VVFVGDLPFAHYGFEGLGEVDDAVGNPYLGVEIRAPLAPESNSAVFVGILTGQAIFSEEGMDVSDRTSHQFGAM